MRYHHQGFFWVSREYASSLGVSVLFVLLLIPHLLQDGKHVVTLYPEKRRYQSSGSVMTEADMDARIFRDLYVALGDPVGEGAWAVRIHYKPFVRWIWFGGLMIAMGGFMTVADRRYRRRVPGRETAGDEAAAGALV